MQDLFALLAEPRRPWIDPEQLEEKFLALSRDLHPDRVHHAGAPEREAANRRYTELMTAYNCLREPKLRLQHLLELELGAKPREVDQVSSQTMETGMQIARLCRDIDQFLSQCAPRTSPLLRVQTFQKSQEWTDQLQRRLREFSLREGELAAELQQLNAAWPALGENLPLPRLEAIYRQWSYLARWREQLQERLYQLTSLAAGAP